MAADPDTSLIEDIQARLHVRGERLSRPRRAVLQALARHTEHLSAEQVLAAVVEQDPSVHRTTVYRNLEALVELGVVQHVHLSHAGAVYHLIPDEGEHLHLQCTCCAGITDVPSATMRAMVAEFETSYGFALDLGHVALTGTCTRCRSRPGVSGR